MGTRDRKQRERQATRQRILDATTRILAERGLQGLSIRRVAGESEYAPGTVYLYFENKDDLLHQWMQSGFALYQQEIEAVPPAVMADPEQALAAIMRCFITFALENAHAYRLAISSEMRAFDLPPPLDSEGFLEAPGNALVTAQLRALAAAGRLPERDIPYALASLTSAMMGLVLTLLDQQPLDRVWRDGLVEYHVASSLRALLGPPAGGTP